MTGSGESLTTGSSASATPPLSTTDLVHECYLKPIDQTRTGWQDRLHFFATAATGARPKAGSPARCPTKCSSTYGDA